MPTGICDEIRTTVSGRSSGRQRSILATTDATSGISFSSTGVSKQTQRMSAFCSASPFSVVNDNRPDSSPCWMSASSPGSKRGAFPSLSCATTSASKSNPITLNCLAQQAAVTQPRCHKPRTTRFTAVSVPIDFSAATRVFESHRRELRAAHSSRFSEFSSYRER